MSLERGNRVVRLGLALVSIVAIAALAGCESLSDSSASISDFVSSPITSWSASSSPEIAYRAEVRDFTKSHVKAGGTAQSLRGELGRIAAKHGISNWEVNEATYVGIGQGLNRADYNKTEMEAFVQVLAPTPEQVVWIHKGYGH